MASIIPFGMSPLAERLGPPPSTVPYDTQRYDRGFVSENGASVIGRTLSVATSNNTWTGIANQRRCSWFNDRTTLPLTLKQNTEQQSDRLRVPDPAGWQVPILMTNTKWYSLRYQPNRSGRDIWYVSTSNPRSNIYEDQIAANPSRSGQQGRSTLPALIDAAVSPNGEFRCLLVTMQAEFAPIGTDGVRAYCSRLSKPNVPLWYFQIAFANAALPSTRAVRGGVVVTNSGRVSFWAVDAQRNNLWCVATNFGEQRSDWRNLTENVLPHRSPLSRWQTFVGDVLYSGFVSYYGAAAPIDVYTWSGAVTNAPVLVSEADLPYRAVISASGGVIGGRKMLALNLAGSYSATTGPTLGAAVLWDLTNRVGQETLAVTMLCISPGGGGIAALSRPSPASDPFGHFVYSNRGSNALQFKPNVSTRPCKIERGVCLCRDCWWQTHKHHCNNSNKYPVIK